jgi:cyanate permease
MRTERLGLVLFLLILVIGNLTRTGVITAVRTVDVLQLLAAGILIGVLLPELISRVRAKDKADE